MKKTNRVTNPSRPMTGMGLYRARTGILAYQFRLVLPKSEFLESLPVPAKPLLEFSFDDPVSVHWNRNCTVNSTTLRVAV